MFARTISKFNGPIRSLVRATSDSAALKGSRTVTTGEKGINKATLLGRVGRDSELRGTEANPVSIFPLATSLTLKTKDGDYVQKTEWHRVCVFKPYLRDVVAPNIKKGDRIYITGSISYTSYTDKNNQLQKVTSILADEIIMLSARSRNRENKEEAVEEVTEEERVAEEVLEEERDLKKKVE